jgi:hypothetical protein
MAFDDRAGSVNGQRVIVGDDDAGSYVASPPKHREPTLRAARNPSFSHVSILILPVFRGAGAGPRNLIARYFWTGPSNADTVGRIPTSCSTRITCSTSPM